MILALKTAGPQTTAWLFGRDEPMGQPALEWASERQLADGLLTKLEGVLDKANATWQDLTGLIIFSGPGSFTSLRIGHTVLNTLADSLDIPIVGALGDNWIADGRTALVDAKIGIPVMPVYGGEANITRPKA